MVLIGIKWVVVFAETFSFGIIIMVYFIARPFALAFDPEMIIGTDHQVGSAGTCFMNALCQGDGSRYTGTLHFLHGNILIGKYIFLDGLCRLRKDEVAQKSKKDG